MIFILPTTTTFAEEQRLKNKNISVHPSAEHNLCAARVFFFHRKRLRSAAVKSCPTVSHFIRYTCKHNKHRNVPYFIQKSVSLALKYRFVLVFQENNSLIYETRDFFSSGKHLKRVFDVLL